MNGHTNTPAIHFTTNIQYFIYRVDLHLVAELHRPNGIKINDWVTATQATQW